MKKLGQCFGSLVLVLACFALAPLAVAQQLVPPPRGEDRGNGNSAAEEVEALNLSTTGSNNTAHGWFSLFSNTTGTNNTADGYQALYGNSTGADNTANGQSALGSNVEGNSNTAMGSEALASNIASDNTAIGFRALTDNTEGTWNTAMGSEALAANTGYSNTGIGFHALLSNTDGGSNTAIGRNALMSNTLATFNTAIGQDSLLLATIGGGNTSVGYGALSSNTSGSSNIALGYFAGWSVTDAFNVICIGLLGENVSNSTWIGNIYGVTTQSGTTAPVVVSNTGQLGTVASAERFKKDIASMDNASEIILSLRPVTFHYKTDAKETPQFGLIAEEVAKVNPALVLSDKDGKPFTVRYDAVNAMLLNEFLKEHRKVQELEAALRAVNERLSEQDAKIQKVSAQVEMSKPAPQTALNDR